MKSMIQGAELDIDITTSIDVTGMTSLTVIWDRPGPSTTKLEKTATFISGTLVRVAMVKADTINMAAGSYWWQGLLVDAAGDEKPIQFKDTATGELLDMFELLPRRNFT